MRGKQRWNTLATALSSRTITGRKEQEIRGNGHDKPYRAVSRLGLQHRQNIPKTRCTTTPWRSAIGFIGGLVPGVDVMAYMMHLPVAKWGRAFLERGLIEARFVKPVYDGETGRCHRRGEQRRACHPGREPRRALRHRHGVAAGGRAIIFAFRLCRCRGGGASASRSMRLPMRSANGSAPCRAPGRRMRPRNIWRIFARPIRSTPGRGSAIPACCSG